jgi:HEAT repeat protein
MVELRDELELALNGIEAEGLDRIADEADSADFEALEELVRSADTAPAARRRALYALGRWPGREDEVLAAVRAALPVMNERERIAAADALGRVGTPAAREELVALESDPAPDVRRQVVHALARIGGETAHEELRTLAEDDPVAYVREQAEAKLRATGGSDA